MLAIKWDLIVSIHKKALGVNLVIWLFFSFSVEEEVDNGVAYDSDFLIDVINSFDGHKGLKSGVEVGGSELFAVVENGGISRTGKVGQGCFVLKNLFHIMVYVLNSDFANCDVVW